MERLPSTIFLLTPLEDLKSIHQKAMEKFLGGDVMMTVNLSFSGKTVGKQVVADTKQVLDATVNELRRRDPVTYGYRDNRTSASFS